MNKKGTKIKGGAIILARKIFDSEIWLLKPDKWFKIWLYILLEVNHTDKLFPRGTNHFHYKVIADKTRCTIDQVKKCIGFLKSRPMGTPTSDPMVLTKRSTRGVIIAVLNYDKYQDFDNYRSTDESTREALEKHQTSTTINKNGTMEQWNNGLQIDIYKQIEPFAGKYAPSMIEDFILHWSEKDKKGKERWQLEKTWEIQKRLAKWQKNKEKWDYEKSLKFQKPVEESGRRVVLEENVNTEELTPVEFLTPELSN